MSDCRAGPEQRRERASFHILGRMAPLLAEDAACGDRELEEGVRGPPRGEGSGFGGGRTGRRRGRGSLAAVTCFQRGLASGPRVGRGQMPRRRCSGASPCPAPAGDGERVLPAARRARVSAAVGPCAAACACAHAGTALAWSRRRRRRQSPPGARARRPPPALGRPAPRARPAGSALRERRRRRREARPGAGGRRRTTASLRSLRRLGAGGWGAGQWAPGGGVRPGPRPPQTRAGAAVRRPGAEAAEATIPCFPGSSSESGLPRGSPQSFQPSPGCPERETLFLLPPTSS